ncbi:subunit SecA of protein translocase [Chloropicon primus]|uniref:Protein translocase subunit SecA n=2 Tax=Chloropicon primus TaxID=1764295 RepID=A0A5B8MBE1_9CHLO|nr:subunit SecA of protein translocase [Chloropicon primus]|eukprot:QDZ17663.1 subunit SecA of protein translocase [Chloropicon primus]
MAASRRVRGSGGGVWGSGGAGRWDGRGLKTPIWKRFLGRRNDLRGLENTVRTINDLEDGMKLLSNAELRAKTEEFKQRLEEGEGLDSILPEAFAVVREASSRVLGLRHFDVQLLGGMVLHKGEIAEMQTGEGKTLVSTLPAYLNALGGKGVQVVTVNDYLARRDAEWMGQLHRFLGLSVDVIQGDSTQSERKRAYGADITYVTNSELGFDYLRDNMVLDASELVLQRELNFAIIDEVDSVLIDEGRNPLLISYTPEREDGLYHEASRIASLLVREEHFTSDAKEKTVELTEGGMEAVEALLGVEQLWEGGSEWGRYILDALKAKEHFHRDVHYIVRDNQIQIIDEFTGRVKPRSRWSDGIHQAVEAKEGLEVQGDQMVAASITYQCFFKMYNKLSGMTGTAATESEEFWETYGLRVVPIPTNKYCIREDTPSLIYPSEGSKWEGVANEVAERHSIGQPVLVGTTSVGHSELLSRWLSGVGIPHSLLNAKPANAAQEAEIISQAGRFGAVTISTNMAGRGTDILLGGNPYEMVRIVLLQNLCSALMKSETCPDFSGLSEIINIEIPPELLGLMARAKASAMSECGPSLTLNEVEQLVIELCNFARQILGGGEEQSLALVESKNFSALESLLGTMELPASQQSLPTTALQKFANAAVFLYSYCGEVCSREGDLVRELGGLHVVGTQLHDSRRIDNQLRGRAGRQGDPGSTIFILSLQDDLLKIHGGDKTASLMTAILDETTGVTSRLLDSQLLTLQRSVEEWYTGIRKQVYKYDQFLDIQRNQIYRLRKHILTSSADELMHLIFTYIRADVAEAVERNVAGHPKQWDISKVCEDVERSLNEEGILQPQCPAAIQRDLSSGSWKRTKEHRFPTTGSYLFAYQAAAQKLELGRVEAAGERRKRSPVSQKWSPEANFVVNELTERVLTEYFLQVRSAATSRRGMSDILSDQRYLMLELVDKRWQKHLKHMSSLRNSVSLRVFGQLDPLEEYKVDSAKALLYLVNSIQREIIRDLFSALR